MIIVLVFVPLFALSGIEGRLFAPLGQAYIISILASLVVSITLTPVMAYYMLPGLKRLGRARELAGPRAQARLPRRCSRAPSAHGARSHRGHGAGGRDRRAWPRSMLPRAFLPPFNEGTFTINLLFNPGVSLAESNRVGLDRRAPDPRRAGGEDRSGGAPAAPSSTSMPKASIPPRSTSI